MGAALARRYDRSREVIAWKRCDLDISRPEDVRSAVRSQAFSTLVYTGGTTSVDYCEEHPEESRLTNADTPQVLAEVCQEKGAKLIHVSTDYVFDGNDPALRSEADATEPVCVYGRHKLAGEQAVQAVSESFLILRVSWLFGPDKPSFIDVILDRALSHDHVEAISDKVSSPTYSEDLARWIEPMLDETRYSGVLHLSNDGATSWQAYGQAALDIAATLGLPLRTNKVHGVLRRDFTAFKAVRPEFTAFDTSKYQKLSGERPRMWQDALREYLERKFAR